jgi:ketose-bisphosphate aldolase
MPVCTAREILRQASAGRYAVGAFNITNILQFEAVVEAAVDKRAPVIVQVSVTPSKFIGERVLVAVYRALAESAPVPVVLHLDHCTDVAYCKYCVDRGYTNIMIDASKKSFEENIRLTREVCDYAHSRQAATVEGELGTIAGVEDQVRVAEDRRALCDPDSAADFVARTGVDFLAPAIGTAHGIYTTADPKLDFTILERVFTLLNGESVQTPLVIHGGTGLRAEVVQKLVWLGGSKFNVSTELKHLFIDSVHGYISEHRREYDPGKVDAHAKKETIRAIESWIDLLGCAGKAGG